MYRLIVKDFGPLKDVDIELNRINIFIGENGSGKSVLAKLIDTILDFKKSDINDFINNFETYNINFITNETNISLIKDNDSIFRLKNNEIYFSKEHYDIDEQLKKLLIDIKNTFPELSNIKSYRELNFIIEHSDYFNIKIPIFKNFKNKFEYTKPKYIPAERNLISLFNRYLSTFITAEIPLPKFLLNFSSDYIKAREEFRELEFLNIKYINSTEDRIYYDNSRYLKLEHSSSGIQSALPLYLTLKYYAQKKHSVIIEEPEQNLFPKAQKETVEFILENISQNSSLYLMTHSPYILTSINNLILANDVKRKKGDSAIKGIVKEEHCIDFDEVSAYFIDNGKAVDIKNYENRLINATFIDSISDKHTEIIQ